MPSRPKCPPPLFALTSPLLELIAEILALKNNDTKGGHNAEVRDRKGLTVLEIICIMA